MIVAAQHRIGRHAQNDLHINANSCSVQATYKSWKALRSTARCRNQCRDQIVRTVKHVFSVLSEEGSRTVPNSELFRLVARAAGLLTSVTVPVGAGNPLAPDTHAIAWEQH